MTDIAEKKYEIIEYKGEPARLYPNGSIRDERGRLLEKPPYLLEHTITAETSPILRNRRKELMLQAVESGVMKATDAPDQYSAISRIIQRRAEVAMSDDGRAGNEAAKIVLDAIDAYQERRTENTHVERHEYVVSEETQNMLLEIMGNRQIMEGKVTDVPERLSQTARSDDFISSDDENGE